MRDRNHSERDAGWREGNCQMYAKMYFGS